VYFQLQEETHFVILYYCCYCYFCNIVCGPASVCLGMRRMPPVFLHYTPFVLIPQPISCIAHCLLYKHLLLIGSQVHIYSRMPVTFSFFLHYTPLILILKSIYVTIHYVLHNYRMSYKYKPSAMSPLTPFFLQCSFLTLRSIFCT